MDIRVKRATKQVKTAIVMSFIMAFISVFGIFYSTTIEVAKLANKSETKVLAADEENYDEIKTSIERLVSVQGPIKMTTLGKSFSFNQNLKMRAANEDNLQVEESAKSNTVLKTPVPIKEDIDTGNTAVVEEAISNNTNLVPSEEIQPIVEESQPQSVEAVPAEPIVVDDPIKKVDRYSDLAVSRKISVDKMNTVIAKSAKMCGGTPFEGQGAIFIEASERSGLDPIYIFAHACFESGYGKSSQARKKHNYFGIASFDSSPNSAYVMGNDMRSGIVNGAIWISENYYKKGQTTLHSMIYGKKCYASAKDRWINNILSIMNRYTD